MVRFCTKQVPASTPDIALPVGYSADPTEYTSYVCKWYAWYLFHWHRLSRANASCSRASAQRGGFRQSFNTRNLQIEVICSVEAAPYLELPFLFIDKELVFCGWWWDKISTGASAGCLSNGISGTGWQLRGVFWSWLEKLYDESLRLYTFYIMRSTLIEHCKSLDPYDSVQSLITIWAKALVEHFPWAVFLCA